MKFPGYATPTQRRRISFGARTMPEIPVSATPGMESFPHVVLSCSLVLRPHSFDRTSRTLLVRAWAKSGCCRFAGTASFLWCGGGTRWCSPFSWYYWLHPLRLHPPVFRMILSCFASPYCAVRCARLQTHSMRLSSVLVDRLRTLLLLKRLRGAPLLLSFSHHTRSTHENASLFAASRLALRSARRLSVASTWQGILPVSFPSAVCTACVTTCDFGPVCDCSGYPSQLLDGSLRRRSLSTRAQEPTPPTHRQQFIIRLGNSKKKLRTHTHTHQSARINLRPTITPHPTRILLSGTQPDLHV